MPFLFPRRELPAVLGLHALALGVAADGGDQPRRSPDSLAPLNRFPRMVQEYFVRQVRAAEQKGERARAALRTKADAEAYIRDVRAIIADCFGPFPARTPLNPRVTG